MHDKSEEGWFLVSFGFIGSLTHSISPPRMAVKNDAFRTLATDQDFKDKVSEEALVRLLDAFAWSHSGQASARGSR